MGGMKGGGIAVLLACEGALNFVYTSLPCPLETAALFGSLAVQGENTGLRSYYVICAFFSRFGRLRR